MPPLPPVPGVLKTMLRWDNSVGISAYSHMYTHTTTSVVTSPQLNAMAGIVGAAWNAQMLSQQANTWHLANVTCEDLGSSPAIPGVWTGSSNGLESSPYNTAETCLLVNFQIGRRYRGGHPRIYLPLGVSSDLTSVTHWASSFLTTTTTKFTTFYNAFLGSLSGGPITDFNCSVSYYSGRTLRPTPVVDPHQGFSLNPIPGSQRRRMGR